jgi:probable HAF family extracellular repeat protein
MTLRSLTPTWTSLCLATALVFSPAVSNHTQQAQTTPGPYTLVDLGTLGGGSTQAVDVNDAGQVTGYSTSGTSTRAFLWSGGTMRDLGSLGTSSLGNAINGLGDVVGLSQRPPGAAHATLWRGAAIIDLTPDLASPLGSTATAINDHGQVLLVFSDGRAFVWENGNSIPIGGLAGSSSYPADINNAVQVVGSAASAEITPLGPMPHAILWENGVTTDLGLLPGDEESGASAINSHGVIVGSSGRTDPETYETFYRPFIYQNGTMTPISAPSMTAYAGDINDSGVVVGTMRAGGAVSPWHAWIYANGVVTNLNSLKPSGTGLHLAYGQAINNAGQITGVAYDAQGRYHGYLLTPCNPCGPPPVVPSISVNDVSGHEGRSGTTNFTFTVSLSEPTTATVAVNFITANGSAIAGVDYNFANGTLLFSPGQVSRTVNVAVRGDRSREADESFTVRLSNADGATILDGSGSGIIRNDDK